MADPDPLFERVARALAPRFRLEREVSEGGMGVVYAARDTELKRLVAVKVLKPQLASAKAAVRFVREAQAQASLQHPNIVAVFDTIEREGLSLIIMEFVSGPTLQRALETGPLSLEDVRRLGAQLASALEAAHAKGIIHRDIKPGNIFLDGDHVLLGDFGIVAFEGVADTETTTVTQEGQQPGTFAYMSPEQKDGLEVDRRTDIYSLGLVLRETATGLNPIEALHQGEWSGVPSELEPLLRGMLAARRDKRMATAREVQEKLTSMPTSVLQRRRWHRWAIGVGAAAAVVLYIIIDGDTPPLAAAADLVVLPVEDPGGTGLGSNLAQLIEGNLEWFPLLRIRTDDPEDKESLRGVEYRLRGDLTVQSSRLLGRFAVRDSSGKLHENITVTGDSSDLQHFACAVADSVVRKVFRQLYDEYRSFGCRVADVQAVRRYFEGAEAFRQGNWEQAERSFEEALARDPGRLQARWELMVARRYQRKSFDADLRYLLEQRDSLPPFYRALVEAQLTPELHERFKRYAAVVKESQGASKALLLYTNELYHRGSLIGRPIEPVVDTMSALADRHRDMQHTSTYDISIWGNIRLGREDSAWADYHRRSRLVGKKPDRNGPFQRFAIWSRFEPWKANLARAVMFRSPDGERLRALTDFSRLGTMFDIPETQIYLGDVLVKHAEDNQQGSVGRLAQGLGHVMLGRTSIGLDWIDSAAVVLATAEMELQRHEWPVMLAALGLPVAAARVNDARAWLRTEGVGDDRSLGARAHWTLGMDALARGDTSEAAQQLAHLRLRAGQSQVASRLASLLAASLLGAGGAYRAALDSTRVIFLIDSTSAELSPFARAATYLNRGAWQRDLGAGDLADSEWLWYENSDYEGWPTGVPQQGEVDAVLSVYGRLLRAELAAGRRNRTKACRFLPRVREIWSESEPSMNALRARADSAIARARCL